MPACIGCGEAGVEEFLNDDEGLCSYCLDEEQCNICGDWIHPSVAFAVGNRLYCMDCYIGEGEA